MEQVLRIIADYQWWIYGVLGLILIFYLRRAIMARRENVRSIFKLEQEQAQARYNRSAAISAVILLVAVAVFLITNPVLTPRPQETPVPTPMPTTGPLGVPTLTPTPLPPTMTPTPKPTPTPLKRPTPVTPTPEVVATVTIEVRLPACPNPNARITSPGSNQVVSGNVPIHGTANVENLHYFKIEIGPGSSPRDHEWTVVGELRTSPVSRGQLGTFNSGAYAPGVYTLRLVVVDQTGNYPEPCRVTVIVQP